MEKMSRKNLSFSLAETSAAVMLLLLFLGQLALAKTNSVVINEIAWMGNKTSYNDEWIELYNTSNSDINLEGWRLTSTDNSPKIVLSGIIPAKGFFLLERSDDNTLPNIEADLIYKGALANTGEKLTLFDQTDSVLDQVDCSQSWFAGENDGKRTMERKSANEGNNPDNWQNSSDPEGTPKTANSLPVEEKISPSTVALEEVVEKVTEEDVAEGQKTDLSPEITTASLIQNITKKPSFYRIASLGACFSFFSGLIAVFIKKKLIFSKY